MEPLPRTWLSPARREPSGGEGALLSQGHGCTHWVISQRCAASPSDELSLIIPPGPAQPLRSQFPLLSPAAELASGLEYNLGWSQMGFALHPTLHSHCSAIIFHCCK